MKVESVVICAARRTPMGSFQGALAGRSAPELGAAAIGAALADAGLAGEQVDEVFMGCVLPAGLGQAPARQAALGAGLPVSSRCTTINKMCGSGMRALMHAVEALLAGAAEVVVAGGMESMSNAPYLLPKARAGLRMGHGAALDHMFLDGLEDAYESGRLMGSFADDAARELGIDRARQDDFAIASLARAVGAIESGAFGAEIVPVEPGGRGGAPVDTDEPPGRARPEKIPTLRPAFAPEGSVTAANASSISDGAAALVLSTERRAHELGLPVLARVIGQAGHARAPAQFPTAPIGAIEALLKHTGWPVSGVDLFEVNEAFAVVAIAAMDALGLAHERLNVHGGACALGHPIGASGARIVVTLVHALRRRGGRRGLAGLCIGGGEATAMAVELVGA